jgi:putative transposase
VDVLSREALAIQVGHHLRGEHGVDACNQWVAQRRAPRRVFVDDGGEFSGRLLDLWAYHHGVQIACNRPGKPTDNCFVETFNGSLRDEWLNVHWFQTLEEAKVKIEAWGRDYKPPKTNPRLGPGNPSGSAGPALSL